MKRNFLVVALLSATTFVFSQDALNDTKKNSVELYYGICHFFDNSRTNWTILAPISKNKKVIPDQYGFIFSHKLKDYSSVRLSGFMYFMGYLGPYDTAQIRQREYWMFSLGSKHEVYYKEKFSTSFIIEVNYRYGYDMIFTHHPNYWESHYVTLPISDIGLSIGYKLKYNLPFNFYISNESTISRYFYRYSKGIDIFGRIKRSAPNTLTIKIGIGYEF